MKLLFLLLVPAVLANDNWSYGQCSVSDANLTFKTKLPVGCPYQAKMDNTTTNNTTTNNTTVTSTTINNTTTNNTTTPKCWHQTVILQASLAVITEGSGQGLFNLQKEIIYDENNTVLNPDVLDGVYHIYDASVYNRAIVCSWRRLTIPSGKDQCCRAPSYVWEVEPGHVTSKRIVHPPIQPHHVFLAILMVTVPTICIVIFVYIFG